MERSLPVKKKIVESPQVYAAVLTHAHWESCPVEDRRTIWALR